MNGNRLRIYFSVNCQLNRLDARHHSGSRGDRSGIGIYGADGIGSRNIQGLVVQVPDKTVRSCMNREQLLWSYPVKRNIHIRNVVKRIGTGKMANGLAGGIGNIE